MMHHQALDVLIVEDEPQLATLHAEFIENNFNLRVVAYATTLAEAKSQVISHQPRLILLDNYLPDGQGIELMEQPAVKTPGCSVIFITAASDMHTCSQAIRNGAFDYIIKPVSYKRLRNSLERFMQFVQTQRSFKVIDQSSVDALYNLQSKQFSNEPSAKGIEPNTLERVQTLFVNQPDRALAVEDIVEQAGISKTTARRYLEYCANTQFVRVEMVYGNIGHPRRLYRKASGDI
ncbi:Destabilizer of plasmid inheritance [Serratia odorifera]|jgi:two-component system, CitB family, response regulator CitB|uniref:Transcriptional regulatory protein n=3 Tax=Serratia odorifera TaxID=618 RepID=D4E2J1_SEROD|nr:response regulator receiver domain protein [Serratia odorifera DSM 4582]VDZ58919.1 Destabilizer of plasmid inheritance [Serratia odorifera]